MMIALPLMLPAVAPLPVLAMPTAPVVSFEDMLADIAPQPVIPGSVAPIKVAANHLQLDTLGEPASSDVSVPDRVSVTGPEAVYPPVAEAFEAMPAPELMVAAQIIAVAAQLAPSSAKPQNDPEQAETTANEIGLVTQHVSSPTPHQRAAVEPTSFTLPTIATVANIQPQILQELDLARDLAWIGNLAQDIVAASDDRDHLSFRLMPRALGLLDVDLSRSPEGLHIEFTATTERANSNHRRRTTAPDRRASAIRYQDDRHRPAIGSASAFAARASAAAKQPALLRLPDPIRQTHQPARRPLCLNRKVTCHDQSQIL